MVANIAIVVAKIYRFVRNGDDLERLPSEEVEVSTNEDVTTSPRRFRAFTKRAGQFKNHLTSTFFGENSNRHTVLTTCIDLPTETEIGVSSMSKINDLFTPVPILDVRSPEKALSVSPVGWNEQRNPCGIKNLTK